MKISISVTFTLLRTRIQYRDSTLHGSPRNNFAIVSQVAALLAIYPYSKIVYFLSTLIFQNRNYSDWLVSQILEAPLFRRNFPSYLSLANKRLTSKYDLAEWNDYYGKSDPS